MRMWLFIVSMWSQIYVDTCGDFHLLHCVWRWSAVCRCIARPRVTASAAWWPGARARGREAGPRPRARRGSSRPSGSAASSAGASCGWRSYSSFCWMFLSRASNEHSRRFHNHAEVKRHLLALSLCCSIPLLKGNILWKLKRRWLPLVLLTSH